MVGREDGDILQAIAKRDADALDSLYDRYGRLAFGLAYRILGDATMAEEVVQDAYLSVWRNAASFDADRGSARTWLLSIVHHRAIDQLRGRFGRRQGDIDLALVEPLLAVPDPWGEVAASLRAEGVRAALGTLPEEQRRAIELAYFEGLTHQEIAERTGTPLGTIKSRLRLGLHKLHDALVAANVELINGTGNEY